MNKIAYWSYMGRIAAVVALTKLGHGLSRTLLLRSKAQQCVVYLPAACK